MPGVLAVGAVVLLATVLAFSSTPAHAARPLATAIVDAGFLGPEAQALFQRTRAAGATTARIPVYWRNVAPTRPVDAANPADGAYHWETIDRAARLAAGQRLQPLLTISGAPDWAQGPGVGPDGTVRPDPVELGLFAKAAATRYGGAFSSLPRVRYWQAWNEPNISLFLTPQYVDGVPFSPDWYRRMVNEFAAAVKSVHADNLVVAGGTAPFRDISPDVQKVDRRWGPLSFMRALLCLTPSLQTKCAAKVHFDVWAHHPYTSGGPTHHAVLPDDVSLGDLPEMRRVLQAGVRAGNVVSSGPVRFWVTEFSWDSKPPDPNGVPIALEARWTAETLYRAWTAGVSLVTWFLVRDEENFFESGLFFRGSSAATARAKPASLAFRFPVVGFRARGGFFVWGRTPAGKPGHVAIEQTFRGGWNRLGIFRTDRFGIFRRTFKRPPIGSVRARLLGTGEASRPFGLKLVADRVFNPFGSPVSAEP
jgi:hypothetical protein